MNGGGDCGPEFLAGSAGSFFNIALRVEHAIARGLQSGLSGGRKRRAAPAFSVASRPATGLGAGRWSSRTLAPGLRGGPRPGATEAPKAAPGRAPASTPGAVMPARRRAPPQVGGCPGPGGGPGTARRALNGHTGGPPALRERDRVGRQTRRAACANPRALRACRAGRALLQAAGPARHGGWRLGRGAPSPPPPPPAATVPGPQGSSA